MTSSRLILGPLTTTFTPSPACSVYALNTQGPTVVGYQAQSCSGTDGSFYDATTCWPPPSTWLSASPPLLTFGFYSPGYYCPEGYYSACGATSPANGSPSSISGKTSPFQYPLTVGETAIGCCPTGMTCAGDREQTCASYVATGIVSPAGFCPTGSATGSATGYSITTTIVVAATSTAGSSSSSLPRAAVLFAPLIQLVYVPKITTTTSSSSSSSTASILTQTAIVPQNVGLSTGAKIGLGVGIPLAVLLLVGLGTFIFFYRQRIERNERPLHLPELPEMLKKPDNYAYAQPAETYNDHKLIKLQEAPTSTRSFELDSSTEQRRVELPSGD